MALDGPYTLDQLLVMTGQKKSRAQNLNRARKRVVPAKPGDRNIVVGIDPGTRCVGWGVIEHHRCDDLIRLVDCGCIRPAAKLELKERLRQIFSQLEAVLARTRPQAAALEETFAGVNMKSAIAMGEGRGIALLCLARAGLDVLELSPRSIKQAVTGSGAASKARVAAMVAAQLGMAKAPRPEDVTDALAAAIALARRSSQIQ